MLGDASRVEYTRVASHGARIASDHGGSIVRDETESGDPLAISNPHREWYCRPYRLNRARRLLPDWTQ
jgi:hypothetical protein